MNKSFKKPEELIICPICKRPTYIEYYYSDKMVRLECDHMIDPRKLDKKDIDYNQLKESGY